MKRLILVYGLLAVLVGCASNARIASQALDVGDRDMAAIKHQPVLLSVYIEPARANVKLRGLYARNRDTGEVSSFVFFANALLGSKALPQVVADDQVQHLVLLDMPPGRYAITSIGLSFLHSDQPLTHKQLATPIQFEIGTSATYLGRLDVRLTKLGAIGLFGDKPAAADGGIRVGVLDEAYVEWALSIRNEAGEDEQKARQRYPALADRSFTVALMAISPL